MNTHILIFSIVRDLPYLEYCLRSIKKFATGFTGVTIVVPSQELTGFLDGAAKQFPKDISYSGGMNLEILHYDAPHDRAKWHIAHQAEKCRADLYVPADTDFIFFMDSDCFFIEPVSPGDYITSEGKPILCIEEYSKMVERPWQAQTSVVLGRPAQWETMRRHGAIHFTDMFGDFRQAVSLVHGIPFMDYALGLKADFPWGISEFNALGNYVLNSHWHTKYQFIDVGIAGYPEDLMLDVWCHAPPDQAQANRYRGRFPAEMTVKQIWEKLGL